MSLSAHVEAAVVLSLADYTVACICPLGIECAAVEAMLDEFHKPLPTNRDQNAYTFGRLGKHNVVVAIMRQIGNNAAATTATQLLNDFPSIRFGLLVGIGGGVPGLLADMSVGEESHYDVRLGDVVVSQSTDVFGGVVQYDLGKKQADGSFRRTGHLNKPPSVLSSNVKRLSAQHIRVGSQVKAYLDAMLERYSKMRTDCRHPGVEEDRLFRADYIHSTGATCKDCDNQQIVNRRPRPDTLPRIHYGTIGSANVVVKDAETRDLLRKDTGILCVEMEAAGIMDTFPCLVIRGICDYADSHKNKRWQSYAAATAAAYMKELLTIIPPQQVKETVKARELTQAAVQAVLDSLEEPIRQTEYQVDRIRKKQEETRQAEILRWISNAAYKKDYKSARAGLLADSGQWLFQNPEFSKWLQRERSGLFWLRGKPGSGKTKLCAMLVETLSKQKENIIYFFCSRSVNSPDNQDPKAIIRALVHQLCVRFEDDKSPSLVRAAFDNRHSTGIGEDGLDVSESYDILAALLADNSRTTIIVDALDECRIEDRCDLLESLQNVVDSSTSLVKVFISSRADRDIVVRLDHWPNIAIDETMTRRDIERFVEKEVTQSIQSKHLLYGEVSLELESKIAAELLAKSGGMFLWIRLQLQLLCQMQTEYQILFSLGRLPPSLSATYDQIYERIDHGPSTYEAQRALGWLMCAQQPLRPAQWAFAVSWAINKRRASEDVQPICLSTDTLLGMCQNLVAYDEMRDHITYAHVSVREYLETKPLFAKKPLDIMAAETCLRFLINTRLPIPSQLEYGFYKYCARYWIDHVKACAESAPPELDEFLGTRQAPTPAYREWKGAVELFGRRYREYHYADEIGTLTNGLLLAAHYGIRHTALWKRDRHDPNDTDERGLSLLALASQNGHADIVRLLLRNGAFVNPARAPVDENTAICVYRPIRSYSNRFQDKIDECHCLFLAIRGGHPEVVMLLLESGAAFHDPSAFMVAAGYGPPSVFSQILEQGSQAEVSEQTLVMAAMNKKYPQTLKAALRACLDTSITGNVIQAVIENREDKEEIITQFISGRITAHVLTAIWRIHRLPVLEKLLEWIPDLPVTACVIRELDRDALPGEDCVVEVLKALLHAKSINSTTLKAIFRMEGDAFSMLGVLLRSKSCRDLKVDKTKKVAQTATLELLFERYVHNALTEDVILAAMRNSSDSLKLGKLLLTQPQAPPLTEPIVEAAVSNEIHGAELLEYLFSLGRNVSTTEAVVAAAARNQFGGTKIIDLLLSKAENLQIAECVVEAAAGNSSSGSDILQQLITDEHAFAACEGAFSSRNVSYSKTLKLSHEGRFPRVSEAAVIAAVGSGYEGVRILEILSTQCPSLPVTEGILTEASKNTENGFEIVEMLLSQNSSVTIMESVISAAVQNEAQGRKLVDLLLKRAQVISVSEKLVFSASKNHSTGQAIMADILDSGKVCVNVSAVRSATVAGQATWFDKLLSKIDDRVARREYGSIFLAAIEGGDPYIFQRCLDFGGLWSGIDDHGWSAELMAYYKQNTRIKEMLCHHIDCVRAFPVEPSSWELRDSPTIQWDGRLLQISGDNDTDQEVRGNHPFIPDSTSYFEIEIVELCDPRKPRLGTRDSLAIGAIDEFLQYNPAYYSNTGYTHDLFLMKQARCFRAGDTVGYGIDWKRQRQFVTYNGVRDKFDMCFEQLYERRLFPFVCLYAGSGSCKLRTYFRGPFLYQFSSKHGRG